LKKDEDQATQATQQQTRPPNPHNNKPGRPNHSLYFCNFGLKIRKLFYYSNSLDSARSASLPSVDTHRRKYNPRNGNSPTAFATPFDTHRRNHNPQAIK